VGLKVDSAECPHCHRKDANFFDRLEALGDRTWDESRLRYRGLPKVVEQLQEYYSHPDDKETYDRLLAEALSLSHAGYELGSVEISYHDEALNDEFRALRETGKVKVILDNN
jgi:hypothetical protein